MPEIWRYGKLFKVVPPDADTFLIAALDKHNAVDRLRRDGRDDITTDMIGIPSAEDVVGYCKRMGDSIRMRVKHPKHGVHECTAVCREDALLQACYCWGTAEFSALSRDTDTRISVVNSVRIPEIGFGSDGEERGNE